MNTAFKLNDKKFLEKIVADIRSDIDFAYNRVGTLNRDNAHPVLQRISAKMEVLKAFTDSIEPAGD